jgi:hypothetical protein
MCCVAVRCCVRATLAFTGVRCCGVFVCISSCARVASHLTVLSAGHVDGSGDAAAAAAATAAAAAARALVRTRCTMTALLRTCTT